MFRSISWEKGLEEVSSVYFDVHKRENLTDVVEVMNIYLMSLRLVLFHLCICSKGNKTTRKRKRMKINNKKRENLLLHFGKVLPTWEREREREERELFRCIKTRYLSFYILSFNIRIIAFAMISSKIVATILLLSLAAEVASKLQLKWWF